MFSKLLILTILASQGCKPIEKQSSTAAGSSNRTQGDPSRAGKNAEENKNEVVANELFELLKPYRTLKADLSDRPLLDPTYYFATEDLSWDGKTFRLQLHQDNLVLTSDDPSFHRKDIRKGEAIIQLEGETIEKTVKKDAQSDQITYLLEASSGSGNADKKNPYIKHGIWAVFHPTTKALEHISIKETRKSNNMEYDPMSMALFALEDEERAHYQAIEHFWQVKALLEGKQNEDCNVRIDSIDDEGQVSTIRASVSLSCGQAQELSELSFAYFDPMNRLESDKTVEGQTIKYKITSDRIDIGTSGFTVSEDDVGDQILELEKDASDQLLKLKITHTHAKNSPTFLNSTFR